MSCHPQHYKTLQLIVVSEIHLFGFEFRLIFLLFFISLKKKRNRYIELYMRWLTSVNVTVCAVCNDKKALATPCHVCMVIACAWINSWTKLKMKRGDFCSCCCCLFFKRIVGRSTCQIICSTQTIYDSVSFELLTLFYWNYIIFNLHSIVVDMIWHKEL